MQDCIFFLKLFYGYFEFKLSFVEAESFFAGYFITFGLKAAFHYTLDPFTHNVAANLIYTNSYIFSSNLMQVWSYIFKFHPKI